MSEGSDTHLPARGAPYRLAKRYSRGTMVPCAACGHPFPQRRQRGQYCSDHCRNAAWQLRHESGADRARLAERRCAHCHRPFSPQRRTARYCSPRCRVMAWRSRQGQ